MAEPIWEPGVERPDVALRAIYRLHQRGRWTLLADLGVEPSVALHRLSGIQGLASDRSVFAVLRRDPELMLGVVEVLRRYMDVTAQTRLLGPWLAQVLGGAGVEGDADDSFNAEAEQAGPQG